MDLPFSIGSVENLSIFKQNSKLLLRLKMNTSEDNFYEAHQLYKLINFRCLTIDLYDDSIELLYNGIVYFSSKSQLHCTFDLAKVFIETLKKSNKNTIDKELIKKVKVIHMALRGGHEERHEFTLGVLKWSSAIFVEKLNKLKSTQGTNSNNSELNLILYQKTFGHVDLHGEFALNLWNEKNFVQARYHFLHSTDGVNFAKMLIECHVNYGYPSEIDLFLAQAVLQYLSLRNVDTAAQFYDTYTKNHPFNEVDNNFKKSPFINFFNLLFISIRNNNPKMFKTLIELYKPSLNRDPSFADYLERIGQYFFNFKSNKPVKENMFNNLFKMLTNSGEGPSGVQGLASSRIVNDETSDDGWDSSKEDIEDNDLLD